MGKPPIKKPLVPSEAAVPLFLEFDRLPLPALALPVVVGKIVLNLTVLITLVQQVLVMPMILEI
jgi:hypothetical protein